MTEAPTNLMVPTYPRSVQPGIPRLSASPEGWSIRRFGDLLKVVQRPVRMTDEGEYDLVTVKRSRGGIESRGRFRGKDISVKSQFALEGGDFLISKRQIVHGACAVVPEEFAGSIVSNEYSVLRCKSGLDLGFLRYLSHSVYFQQTCFHSSIGVHVEKMIFKLEDWLKFRVNVPPLEEQKRIAAGFEAVDAKLAALREKADGLRQFKTGLMQRLFSQELRFTREDGSDFPDWEERKLGDVATFFKGKGVSKADVEDGGATPCIRYGEIYTLYSERISEIASATNVDPRDLFLSAAGDVIIPASGEDRLDMARACCVTIPGVALGGDINVLRSPIRGDFLAYYLNNARKKEIALLGQGNSVVHLYPVHLRTLDVEIPHPDEQSKIADALMAVDAKIHAVTEQITHMETFKKGLLQKMFV
jgi:type I restriction enzyme, S subunit